MLPAHCDRCLRNNKESPSTLAGKEEVIRGPEWDRYSTSGQRIRPILPSLEARSRKSQSCMLGRSASKPPIRSNSERRTTIELHPPSLFVNGSRAMSRRHGIVSRVRPSANITVLPVTTISASDDAKNEATVLRYSGHHRSSSSKKATTSLRSESAPTLRQPDAPTLRSLWTNVTPSRRCRQPTETAEPSGTSRQTTVSTL
jgi:hypothetical protein